MSSMRTSIPEISSWSTITPWQDPDWNERLPDSEEGLFFHTSHWARVLAESYHYTPRYFLNQSPEGRRSLLPVMEVSSLLTGRRGVSLPFSDYAGACCSPDVPAESALAAVLEHGYQSKWKYFEWRGGAGQLPGARPSERFYRHVLALDAEERLFSRLHDTTRRNIKKAQKEKVRVEMHQSLEALTAFCRLNDMTRREHGLPPQPMSFFRKIHEHVLSKSMGFVALGYYQDRVVAGAVYFHFRKLALYKYGASDKAWQHLRANNLLMWEAIRWFAQRGFQSLCFGRTDLHHDGLRHFKQGWGSTEQMLEYGRYDFRKEAFVETPPGTAGLHTQVFSRLPPPLLKIVGALLYRHMG